MKFSEYSKNHRFFDEMFELDGTVRPHCAALLDVLEKLPDDSIGGIQDWVETQFHNEGIVFTVYSHDQNREQIIPIDCLPRIMAANDWHTLESGADQRLRALNLFLEDIYNDAKIVADGVVPKDLIFDCPQYRKVMRGYSPPNRVWVAVCGTDILRTTEGFVVLEDNLRVPSGVSYMIANRKAIKACYRKLFRSCRVARNRELWRRTFQNTA